VGAIDAQGTTHDARTTTAIVGCGYLGTRIARARATGRVLATCRRVENARALAAQGFEVLRFDAHAAADPERLVGFLGDDPVDLFYLVPPGLRARGTDETVAAVARLTRLLARTQLRAAVLASSTAVYGDGGAGELVSADTPAAPSDARGCALLAIESVWRESLPQARVVRLAGLYGPGRVIGRATLEAGAPIDTDPDGWLNLIYVDDAAELFEVVARGRGAPVELGADGHPLRRREYYTGLGAELDVGVKFVPPTQRRGSRRCDIGPTCYRTGWAPRTTDFREGLRMAMRGSE
jgi:nucleoside-diphosphate-sugar epimerase